MAVEVFVTSMMDKRMLKSFIKKMEEYVQHEMLACYKQKANMYLS